ncbi:MAG: hypothetical protein AB8G17_13950 [Gammaproteobacteria bacterium]
MLLTACAPTLHTVKPLPNFVEVGLQRGDKVTVTTKQGTRQTFVITKIQDDVLIGPDARVSLADLVDIKKHAGERPASPCGGAEPLGCSVPWLIALASDDHRVYGDSFYDACAQHDYCYRHGFASYGRDRDACDREFLEDMLGLCPQAATSSFGKIVEAFDDTAEGRRTCVEMANQFHAAVRRFGEDRFETTGSSYCEYDGPLDAPGRAPPSVRDDQRTR